MPEASLIRPMTPGDAEAVARIYEPHVTIGPASFELTPPDAAEMRARHAAITAMYPWLVYERGGEVAGYAYASAHNPREAYVWSVNVTVYIAPEHHRQGVGRALYTALVALLRLQGFCNAIGGITLPNAGSVGLHEAMGFRLVGIYPKVGFKSGAWRDVGWWQMALQDPPPDPAPPRPLPEIADTPAARQAMNPALVLP